MFTGMYLTIAKWLAGLVLVGVVIGGSYYGVNLITSAFRDRTELQKSTADLTQKLSDEAEKHKADNEAAAKDAKSFKDAITERDKAASEAAARHAQTEKDLTNARTNIATWRSKVDAATAACLQLPLPAGLFPDGDETPAAGPAPAESGVGTTPR